ncbi:site-specific integrase [Vibrio vulnificus]|nr:site-specific integrase [Vibrio vulnificus]
MPSTTIEKVSPNNLNCRKFKVRARAHKKEPFSHNKCRTFSTRAQAVEFKKKLEKSFLHGDFSFFLGNNEHFDKPTIRVAISHYLQVPSCRKNNEKHLTLLERIMDTEFANIPIEQLQAKHWYFLAAKMNEQWKVKPQTTAGYLAILNSVLKDCATLFGLSIPLDGYSLGLFTARRHGFVSRSAMRTRRPSSEEWGLITAELSKLEQKNRRSVPMLDIVEFAVETGARLGEICGEKITWADWDPEEKLLTIHNRKNPRKGTHTYSRFVPSSKAIEIIVRQPRGKDSDSIFPYNPRTVAKIWQVLMKELGILDLRFHDIRAEALCRMYEQGMTLSDISKISGHKDLNTLNNVYLRFFPTQPSRLAA